MLFDCGLHPHIVIKAMYEWLVNCSNMEVSNKKKFILNSMTSDEFKDYMVKYRPLEYCELDSGLREFNMVGKRDYIVNMLNAVSDEGSIVVHRDEAQSLIESWRSLGDGFTESSYDTTKYIDVPCVTYKKNSNYSAIRSQYTNLTDLEFYNYHVELCKSSNPLSLVSPSKLSTTILDVTNITLEVSYDVNTIPEGLSNVLYDIQRLNIDKQ